MEPGTHTKELGEFVSQKRIKQIEEFIDSELNGTPTSILLPKGMSVVRCGSIQIEGRSVELVAMKLSSSFENTQVLLSTLRAHSTDDAKNTKKCIRVYLKTGTEKKDPLTELESFLIPNKEGNGSQEEIKKPVKKKLNKNPQDSGLSPTKTEQASEEQLLKNDELKAEVDAIQKEIASEPLQIDGTRGFWRDDARVLLILEKQKMLGEGYINNTFKLIQNLHYRGKRVRELTLMAFRAALLYKNKKVKRPEMRKPSADPKPKTASVKDRKVTQEQLQKDLDAQLAEIRSRPASGGVTPSHSETPSHTEEITDPTITIIEASSLETDSPLTLDQQKAHALKEERNRLKIEAIAQNELRRIKKASPIQDKEGQEQCAKAVRAIQGIISQKTQEDIATLKLQGNLTILHYPIDKVAVSNVSRKLKDGSFMMIPTVSLFLTRRTIINEHPTNGHEYRIAQEILALLDSHKDLSNKADVSPSKGTQIRFSLYWSARDTRRTIPSARTSVLISEKYAVVANGRQNEIIRYEQETQ